MIRTILAIIYSAFWCGAAIIVLLIKPKSSDYVLIQIAKKNWSIPMLKWIIGADIQVEFSPKALMLFKSNKGAVIMANHSSFLDIVACFVSSPTPIVYLAKASLRKVPLLGSANARVGTVFVNRGNKTSAFKAIKTLVKTVKSGRSVVVFPEGTRSKDGKLKPFKKGGFHLAVQASAPVIPVHINGTYKRLPPGNFSIKKLNYPIIVRYGDPIESNDVEELRNLTYDSICKLRG